MSAYNVGNRKQVFIDWDLVEPGYGVRWSGDQPDAWEVPYGVVLATHNPRLDMTPMVQPEHPWESRINVYCTLFEDEGRFRLYYECHYVSPTEQPSDLKAMMAYAESTDGVHWVKPKIGTVSFFGSTDNNLVYGIDLSLGRGAHGATVFKDPNASPAERYKLIHMGRDEDKRLCVFGATSPDGLHWQPIVKPLITDFMSDTQTVATFDVEKGRYVGYFRGWKGLTLGQWHGRRTIAYAETEDFGSWPVPQTIVAPDVHDTPDADIYTNSYARWPGAANAHLMFPAYYRRTRDVTEIRLMTSRDGQLWERPTYEPLVPGGEPGRGYDGGIYAGCGLVSFTPGEWTLPVGPVWHTHNQGHHPSGRPADPPSRGILCRAIWRQDSLMSIEAEARGGFTTVPLTYDGDSLRLNVWTRFGGEVRAELAEVTGETVPGYALADCDPLTGDVLDGQVTWQGKGDLSAWRGKPMRVRFQLRRARLHALRFA